MRALALLVIAGASTGPTPSPLPDATSQVRGAVNVATQAFGGHKDFDAGISAISVDAGVLVCGVLEGQQGAPRAVTSHNSASAFTNSQTWDQEPQNTRSVDTYAWSNGGTQGMGLDLSTPTYSSPAATPRLNVYGAISPYLIDNKSGGSTASIRLLSNLAANATMAAVQFDQTNARVSDQCQYSFMNAGVVYACFLPSSGFSQELGQLSVVGRISAGGDTSHGAFTVSQNGSGTIALECADQGSGCYLPLATHQTKNANLHGSLNVRNVEYLDGGVLINAVNPGGLGYSPNGNTDNVFTVDAFGGFGNMLRQATFAAGVHQLPPCPDLNPPINSYGNGTIPGSLHFAYDTAHYYVCKAGDLPDAGNSGYKQVAEANPVYLPPVLVNAQLAVATLGGFVSPQENPINLEAINIYVSVAGSGGSTNATVRATNGESGQCDCSFACNLGTGPQRITCSGVGCATGLRGTTWSFAVQTLGACSGSPPTWVGSMTPEGHWR